MPNTHRRAATIPATLATMTRDLRRAIRAADPARAPGLVPLRDTGWQLVQLTGELTDLVALLADHTARHTEHAEHLSKANGQPGVNELASACHDLSALRRALDAGHAAARDYYAAISNIASNREAVP